MVCAQLGAGPEQRKKLLHLILSEITSKQSTEQLDS